MRRPPLVALVALVALAAVTAARSAHAEEVEIAPPATAATTPPDDAPPAAPDAPLAAPAATTPPGDAPAPLTAPTAPAPAPATTHSAPLAASRAPQPALSLGSCAETPRGCAAESRASGGWYGYQTLITDSVALTLAFASVKLGGVGGLASFGTYLLGGPIVHAVNGRPAMLAASLGTRVVSPVLGGVSGLAIGAAVDGCGGGGDYLCGGPIAGAAIGALSGLAAAVVLDAAVYSRVHREAPPPAREAWDGKPTLAPTVAASPTGGTVGLGGVF